MQILLCFFFRFFRDLFLPGLLSGLEVQCRSDRSARRFLVLLRLLLRRQSGGKPGLCLPVWSGWGFANEEFLRLGVGPAAVILCGCESPEPSAAQSAVHPDPSEVLGPPPPTRPPRRTDQQGSKRN